MRKAIHIAPLIAAILLGGALYTGLEGQSKESAGVPASGAADSARVKELVGEVLDDSYQTMQPEGTLPENIARRARIDVPDQLVALLRLVFYAFVIVAVVLGGLWVFNEFAISRRRKGEDGVVGVPWGAGDGIQSDSFALAQRLVAEKRFAEAIHALLLAAIERLKRIRKTEMPDSLTSREVLRRAGLTGSAHQALSRLVARVEIVQFGGAEAAREDYQECLESYQRLLRSDPEDMR